MMKKQPRAALFLAVLTLTAGALRADETVCTGSISGSHDNVLVPGFATCSITDARIEGNVKVEQGGAVTISGRTFIDGNVQSDGGRFVRLLGGGVTVGGDVQIKKATETSAIQPGTQVLGNFQYEENQAFLFATGAFIQGDFQVFKNLGGASISRNTIRQNLQCKENIPAPLGGGNVVGGNKEDQCRRL